MNTYTLPTVRSASYGMLAFGLLLGAYFGLLTLISGWQFTLEQFYQFWIYLVLLAGGFGLQVALFTRLRQLLLSNDGSRTVMAASGTTSTAAMISCCAHYLVNVAPVLGAKYGCHRPGDVRCAIPDRVFLGRSRVQRSGYRLHRKQTLESNQGSSPMRTYLIALLALCFNTVSIAADGASAAQSLATQSTSGSGVTVSVTPRGLKEGSWEFDIALNTHSQELKDDLMKSASLIAGGKAHAPAGWKGDPPGGHHRKGVLKFDGIDLGPSEIELRIARPGEPKPRSFRWQLK